MKRPDIAIIGICITQGLLLFICWAACANGAPAPWLATLIAVTGAGLLVYSTTDLGSEKIALWHTTVGTAICWAQLGPTAYVAIHNGMLEPHFISPLIGIALIPIVFLVWLTIWVIATHVRMMAIGKDNVPPEG